MLPNHRPTRSSGEVVTALMIRFGEGDRAAFKPLFALTWPILLHYCRRCLTTDDDAEDAAQESLVKVFSRIADFDRQRDGLAWLLGIASFEVLTVRKRRQRRREQHSDDLSSFESPRPGAEEASVRRELLALLQSAIEKLGPQDRAVLQDILNESTGPAFPADVRTRKRKQRAIERLRLAWRRLHNG